MAKDEYKVKIKWLAKITDRAKKDGMDTSAGSEFDERLNDYGLTKFPKNRYILQLRKLNLSGKECLLFKKPSG